MNMSNITGNATSTCPTRGCGYYSGAGVCVNGTCVCNAGWHGLNDWKDTHACDIHVATKQGLHYFVLTMSTITFLHTAWVWLQELHCCGMGEKLKNSATRWSSGSSRSIRGSSTGDGSYNSTEGEGNPSSAESSGEERSLSVAKKATTAPVKRPKLSGTQRAARNRRFVMYVMGREKRGSERERERKKEHGTHEEAR